VDVNASWLFSPCDSYDLMQDSDLVHR